VTARVFRLFDRMMAGVMQAGSSGDRESFPARLAQAIAWCGPRASASDPRGLLRTEIFRPPVLVVDRAAMRFVLHTREDRVPRHLPPVGDAGGLKGGRLLVYYPDADLSDGAAEVESGGFFDLTNTPPWDTWAGLFVDEGARRVSGRGVYLVSWVPPVLIPHAQAGIEVNPEGCIAWLDSVATPLGTELRARGILG
jgi:hypothetical protein